MTREEAWRRAIDVAADISIPDPLRQFKIVSQPHPHGLELVMTMEAKDRDIPTENITLVQSYVILEGSLYAPPTEVEQIIQNVCRNLAHQMATHEVDEWFHINRERVYDPHA